jgi:sulfopyruvate decarboxylase subunit alpha
MADDAGPLAISIDGGVLAEAIRALGATHIICVPDTNLKTAIATLAAMTTPRMLTVCTEDEAMGINAGLYMAGHKPMLLIQNNGLFAAVNTLKSIAVDAQVPTFMVIGQYGRDVNKPIEENNLRAVRLLEPTLKVWDVPFARIESAQDLPQLRVLWDQAWTNKGPTAALVGAPTS